MIAVSDTSPICYLILLRQIDLLRRLYGQVAIPQAVQDELADARSPEQVRQWIAQPPEWLEIQPASSQPDTKLAALDLGEQSAILLVEQLGADLLVIDEMVGRRVARSRGIPVIGTLGILEEAGRLGWINLPAALLPSRFCGKFSRFRVCKLGERAIYTSSPTRCFRTI